MAASKWEVMLPDSEYPQKQGTDIPLNVHWGPSGCRLPLPVFFFHDQIPLPHTQQMGPILEPTENPSPTWQK